MSLEPQGRYRVTMHHVRFAIVVLAIFMLPACDDTESPADGSATAQAAPPASPTSATPSASPATQPTTGGTPRITFVNTIHDFGVITDADNHTTTFSFTNSGTGTLVISQVKSTCGCTVPALAKTVFAPGESATISVTLDPSGKSGQLNKAISVISNAQPQNVTKLVIRADIRPLIDFDHFLRFGERELGQEHAHRFVLSYRDPELRITDVYTTDPYFSVKLTDVGTPNPVAGGLPYLATLEVTLGSDAPWGILQSQVKFTGRGRAAEQFAPAAAAYSVMISGYVFGDVRLDPIMLLSRDSIGRNRPFKLSAELTRTSGIPFSVTDVRITETTLPGLTPSVVANGPAAYTVYLDGTTPAAGGTINGSLMVLTDIPGEEELPLRFAMYVK